MSVKIGRIGDLFAAAIIESLGASVAIVNQPGCDLIVNYKNKWIRVEVKATQNMQKHRRCFTWKTSTGNDTKYHLTKDNCDIVALVALAWRKAAFYHVDDVSRKTTTHIYERRMMEIDEEQMWIKACEKLTT